MLNYLHKSAETPLGYENYTKLKEEGRWIVFNPRFLFFQGFWFVYYKMYTEAFLYTLFLATFALAIYINPSLYSGLFLASIIGMSFFSYKLYELKLQLTIFKNNNNLIISKNKISPYNTVISLFIIFMSIFAFVYTYLLTILVLMPDLSLKGQEFLYYK